MDPRLGITIDDKNGRTRKMIFGFGGDPECVRRNNETAYPDSGCSELNKSAQNQCQISPPLQWSSPMALVLYSNAASRVPGRAPVRVAPNGINRQG
jgi:hypothetical protein